MTALNALKNYCCTIKFIMNNMKKNKIAVFYGGKITRHLVLIRRAAKKLGIGLDLVSYNSVSFETGAGVTLRGKSLADYGVVFFRTTGKHWEEVSLVLSAIDEKTTVVDPMVKWGRSGMADKAWQMLTLDRKGIAVPRTIYGSLWFLYEKMKNLSFLFPVILKGSSGDRGTRVYRADNLEELEKLVRELRKSETEEGRRYMLQEWIENEGDYRVLVLGEKVLGVMKRTRDLKSGEFRNNFSMGGEVEVADLPEEVKRMVIEATKICGLTVAGVDVMKKGDGYVILEVNKGPQFSGFMKATGINVPEEIVKYLDGLR